MGQKCSSTSLRLGLNKTWLSRWNSPDRPTTIKWLLEDEQVNLYLNKKCDAAGVGLIEIERNMNLQNQWVFTVFLHVTQATLIESNAKACDSIMKDLKKIVGKNTSVVFNVLELQNSGVCAEILAKDISKALENRMPFRSTMKRTLRKALNSGAKGIKIKITGRLNGAEIARSESYSEGSIPLSTLRADIDYCQYLAKTTYGIIGIKIWVNRGIYFGKYFMPLPPAHERPWYHKGRDGYNRNNRNNKRDNNKDNKFISKTY